MRPLIGLPADQRTLDDVLYYALPSTYTRALELAGAAPVLIPLQLGSESLRAIFSRLDGLLLAGGVDVVPQEYGEETQSYCGEIHPARDAVELELVRWALEWKMPLLGICRGIQVLNVAAGGTLYQDISSQIRNSLHRPRRPGDSLSQRVHSITVDPRSILADALGGTQIAVNSMHHQSVKQVAPGFRVVARAADGVIEAIEPEDDRFVLGLQFHPERLVDDSRVLNIFRVFVERASSRKGAG